MKTSLAKLYFALFGATIVAVAACGARSGLGIPEPPERDGGPDAGPDVVDAPPDVPPDVPIVDDCADAGTTYIYLITEENELYSFYPLDMSFHDIGTINCPAIPGTTPYSMAVDRKGTAYVVFSDMQNEPQFSGALYNVNTGDAGCAGTAYTPTQFGPSPDYGMGFSANVADAGETLYIASDQFADAATPELLGTIDVNSFQVGTIGQFPIEIGSAELTGTGDGKLYGFGVHRDLATDTTVYHLVQIDKDTAGIISELPLNMPTGSQLIDAWAFAYWGGDFYFFTSVTEGTSIISRYTPQPGDTVANAVQLPITFTDTIVGAGVSTCAPHP